METDTMSSEDYAQVAREMRQWLSTQAHLPQDVSDNMLCRFAHSCYFDLDQAKKTVDTFFTLRRDYPQFYTDRDPRSPHMQTFISVVNLVHLNISESRNLCIWQLNDPNLEHYDLVLDAKFHLLTNDCWFLANEERFYENDVHVIVDVKDMTSIKVLAKLNMLAARLLSKYQQEAIPVRVKNIHFINSSYIIKKMFSVFKHLFNKEAVKSIHFHDRNSDSLLNFFSKDDLPSDYGGTRPSMDTLMADTMKLVEEKRDIVLKEDFWVAKHC